MEVINKVTDSPLAALLVEWLPMLAIVALAMVLMKLVFMRRSSANTVEGNRFREQVLAFLVVLAAVVGIILAVPIDSSTRGQLLTLLGLLLTAIITLSSPTIAANAMAGFMLRSLRSFAVGDFIQVGEFFGRVTERDLFHVEIQTEDRDLLTIPNTYLASHPIKVVLATGTVVSAEVSLGYDVDNRIVEEALLEAIQAAGLEEGFVHIKALGDFSVVYRAAGFLSNVKQMLSMRSDLRRQMIDQLHQRGIEIVSPSFMNQRANTQPVIPKRKFVVPNQQTDMPENLVFDKAERAQQIKELQDSYSELKLSLAEADTDEESVARKKRRMKAIKRAIGMLEKQID